MPVQLDDASIRLTLETGDVVRELEELKRHQRELLESSRKVREEQEEARKETERGVEETERRVEQVEHRAGGIRFPSLREFAIAPFATTISLVPVVGPLAARLFERAAPFAEFGAPAVSAAIREISEGLPEGRIREAVMKAVEEIVRPALQELSDRISDIQAAQESLQPALDNVLEIAKAQLALGREIDAAEAAEIARGAYSFEMIRNRVQRQARKLVLEHTGEAFARTVMGALKR